MNIKNSKIIVTGGSSGIGKAIAKQLADKGAQVLITGRDPEKLNKVATEIGATPLPFDISKLNDVAAMAQEALALLDGTVDVLVNNAGIGTFNALGAISPEDFNSVFNTNVFGLALFTQALLPAFKKQQSGTIINMASTASLKGFANGTVYAASKFALRGMTQSWQAELRRDNIRVCLINPSEVTTAFANPSRTEREELDNKLGSDDIAHAVTSVIEMRDKAFVPELTVWATNPF